ncbi:hypothetical protein EJ08DRAFT_697013 [Tothia fuscella]|uniref:Fe2OG dioxygenase domain-containing protein n=1 Tax=Tothia fuscella TaxID=1048955 RepID=A0A9P4NSF5_9PEZI|nr:hypothetical protein EJ08DRAFT_697013 [Tothia fuscella]
MPPVAAMGRRDLCETLPYYRSYQSAASTSNGIVTAFMFDGQGHCRDYMDSTVIIARTGGGLEKDVKSGEMKTKGDQSENALIKCIQNGVKYCNPVVVIVGEGNKTAHCKIPYAYNVVPWYKSTDLWSERDGAHRIFKFRLEILNEGEPSWMRPVGAAYQFKLGEIGEPYVEECPGCNESSPQMYLNGWMCLRFECKLFWRFTDGSTPVANDLKYDPRFLKKKTSWKISKGPWPLKPKSWALLEQDHLGKDVSWEAARGICCKDCGMCGSRVHWDFWVCPNTKCNLKLSLPHKVIQPHQIRDWLRPLSSAYMLSEDYCHEAVDCTVDFAYNYRRVKFEIPGVEGWIKHWVANETVVKEPGGPGDMFVSMQEENCYLKRHSMPHGMLKGESSCNHFTANFGMPYKFIASAATRSFEDAPTAVRSARSRMNWARRVSVGEESEEFNEVLALVIFSPTDTIPQYHDDGESSLGRTIATLSLGAPAEMTLRMKPGHFRGTNTRTTSGQSANLVFNDKEPPIPLCHNYEARKTAYDQLQALKLAGDLVGYEKRKRELPNELGISNKGNQKPVITMRLKYGDMVSMHGAKIQTYYEHAVTPEKESFLRFALTCRQILSGHLPQSEMPGYEIGRDPGWYDGGLLGVPEEG